MSPPRGWVATLTLAVLLLTGGFELHGSPAEHSLASETISIDARHARAEAHYETSALESRAACTACLLHHSAGLPIAALSQATARPAGRRPQPHPADPELAPIRARGNPRAPPFA